MKIFLIIILTLFLIFAMIMISSVHIYIFFKDELKFKVRFWFYTYKSENIKSNVKKKKSFFTDKKKKKHKVPKKKSLSQKISESKDLYHIGSNLIPKLFRMIHIKYLRLYIAVGSDEAAITAINYGRLCAVVYPLMSITLKNNFLSRPDIQIAPDFQLQKSKILIESKIQVNAGRAFGVACIALVSYLKLMYKFYKSKQKKEID